MKITARLVEVVEMREPERSPNPRQPIYGATKTRLVFEVDGRLAFNDMDRLIQLGNGGRPVTIEVGS